MANNVKKQLRPTGHEVLKRENIEAENLQLDKTPPQAIDECASACAH